MYFLAANANCSALWVVYTSGLAVVVDSLPQPLEGRCRVHSSLSDKQMALMMAAGKWTRARRTATETQPQCQAKLILLPHITLVNISKTVYIFLILLQLWYLERHLCTNTKVITVAVKSCIFEISLLLPNLLQWHESLMCDGTVFYVFPSQFMWFSVMKRRQTQQTLIHILKE